MEDSTKNKVKGAAHELKGKVKEEAGRATGDDALQAQGKVEVGGKVQKKAGDVEREIEKLDKKAGT